MAQGINNYRVLELARIISQCLTRPGAYRLARAIAHIFHACDKRGRSAVISNLTHILSVHGDPNPAGTAKLMAKKVFLNFGLYLADFFRYESLTSADIAELINIDGLAHLENAYSAGRGVILITAHLGNWELGGAVITAMGYPLTAVAFPERVGKTNELFQKQRRRRGMQILTFGEAARGALAALKRGEMVAMLADRDFTNHRDMIDFFGRPARLPAAPARISAKTGAPILPGFILRQSDNRFTMRFHPPLWPESRRDNLAVRTAIRDILQAEVSADPTQWFVFEDFWNTGGQHAASTVQKQNHTFPFL